MCSSYFSFVLLNTTATSNTASLLSRLATGYCSTSALWSSEASNVLALNDVLLELLQLLLKHSILHLPLLCSLIDVFYLALQEVSICFVSALFTTLKQRLQALRHAQHVYVFGTLLKLCSLQCQHL